MNSFEWLTQLISFDTTSRNSNLALIQAIQNWLSSHSIDYRLTYDDSGKKANLFATLPAHNGDIDGGIILSGHTDVVPVDSQVWDTNPFEAKFTEDRIFGRGSSDMKGFIAVVLALVPEFKKMHLHQPIHFAFTYDEEVGCRGVPGLIADFQKHNIHPVACIVGEPTEMRPVIGHKGIHAFRCRLYGLATHSSLTPEGCNAVEHAAQLINWIRDFANQIKLEGPLDTHYDVPFTTMTTNMIQGGTAVNIIPSYCEFFFEFRNLPEVDPSQIISKIKTYATEMVLPAMRSESDHARIEIEAIGSVPGFSGNENANIIQLIRAITKDYTIHKVSYATEAGLFQQANIATLVCGPGSIEQAHRPNEFIMIDQIKKCEDFFRQLFL